MISFPAIEIKSCEEEREDVLMSPRINEETNDILQITVYNQEWLTIDHQEINLPTTIQIWPFHTLTILLLEKKSGNRERCRKLS